MATLQKLGDEALCPINTQQLKIGRAVDNDIIIDDESVSGYHARITIDSSCNDEDEEKTHVIEDLSSTNNTYVNNKEVSNQPLIDGDIIRIGRTRLKFSTKEYTPPQSDFQKTQKLGKYRIPMFLFSK